MQITNLGALFHFSETMGWQFMLIIFKVVYMNWEILISEVINHLMVVIQSVKRISERL